MTATKGRMRLCITWLVLNLLFIWGNSTLPGETSKAFSSWVKDLIALLLDTSPDASEGDGLLRKIAHLLEFCSLGMCLTWLGSMLGKKPWLPLLFGFLVACTDELIQCVIPDRGPAVADVTIDTLGVALGIVLLLSGYTLYQKRKNKTILEETTT